MKQEVWDIDIFVNLISKLKEATTEILVATAWFTDEELFNILCEKAEKGLEVIVIISDHKDNHFLDFNKLISKGGKLIRIPIKGRGMMHDKYCIIDSKIAINGSYNWTKNARINNKESVICTDDKNTVDSFRNKFMEMNSNYSNIKEITQFSEKPGFFERLKSKIKNNTQDLTRSLEPQKKKETPNTERKLIIEEDFDDELNSIIASDINDFNRDLLKDKGYNSAKEHNGDHNIMSNSLNSVYSLFVYEIDVVEEKKTKLIGKIKNYKEKVLEQLKTRILKEKSLVEKEIASNIEDTNRTISNLTKEIAITEKSITDIEQTHIKHEQQRIDSIKEEIAELEHEFIKPPISWFNLISNSLLSLGLLTYIGLFYSSAGYILLYSVADANINKHKGLNMGLSPNEIYDPEAFAKAAEKGGTAILFILFFVFLPIACSLYCTRIKMKEHYEEVSLIKKIKKYSLIIFIDGFIAYKVTSAIYKSKHMCGDPSAPIPWEANMAIKNIDFYLVFALGTFAVILFEIFMERIKDTCESRNLGIARKESKLKKKQKNNKLKEIQENINKLEKQRCAHEIQIIELRNNLDTQQKELIYLPNKEAQSIKEIENECLDEKKTINNKTEVKINNIENDKFPISVDSLSDRISVFLEGWNEWLHDEFSVEKAKSLSEKAIEAAKKWKENKICSDIDKRIKSN